MSGAVWPTPPPSRIIVRMPNWIGDLVMATPVLVDLRAHFPQAKITAMCLSGHTPLLEKEPALDEVFGFRRPSGWIHRAAHADLFEPLRFGNYDLGLLLTNSLSSAWWFVRGHVAHRIGYPGHWRRPLLNYVVPKAADYERVHQVIAYKRLLEPMGIPVSDTAPRLFVRDQVMEATRQLLLDKGVDDEAIVVGVNPGAAYGTAKCWLPERFREVTLRLLQHPRMRILYFGDQSTAPLVGDICRDLPDRVINLAGKTNLAELMAYIKLCRVLLTNDSGPMHMAAALGTPPLALFGSTNDVRTGPYGLGQVIHKHVECSPCYKRVCPIDFRCMKRITVDEVHRQLLELIKS